MKRILPLLVTLAGCASADLCAPYAGQACISIELHSGASNVNAIDQVQLDSPELRLGAVTTPPVPERASLPIGVPIAAGTFTGGYSISILAKLDGKTVGTATVSGHALSSGEHQHVVVDLQPPNAAAPPFTVVQGSPMGETLTAIWGADADLIFAVGSNGVHLDHFDGSWHRKQTTLGRDYYAVWGSGPNDVYAVGRIEADGRGVVEHFDGMAWREEYLADNALYGVWGDGTLVLAVAADGMLYGKVASSTTWGKRLSTPLAPSPNVTIPSGTPVLFGISGNGPNDFVMPAGPDRFFHYEGNGDFINLDPAVDRTISFRSVWAMPGGGSSVFLGTNYLGICWLTSDATPAGATMLGDSLFRLTGDESQPGSDQLFIRGIYGIGSRVGFVGDGGHIFVYDVGADSIGPLASPTDASLYGVWGATLDDVWIVGERELLLHGSLAP